MLKYCLEHWNKYSDNLEAALRERTDLNICNYIDLVRMVVDNIFVEDYSPDGWDSSKITLVDNGDYQGTQLFLIPRKVYQPCEWDYLMTYVGYGSCSGCDTLQAIQDWDGNKKLTDRQVGDFMRLCRDLVVNTIKPYNNGWRNEEEWEPVKGD